MKKGGRCDRCSNRHRSGTFPSTRRASPPGVQVLTQLTRVEARFLGWSRAGPSSSGGLSHPQPTSSSATSDAVGHWCRRSRPDPLEALPQSARLRRSAEAARPCPHLFPMNLNARMSSPRPRAPDRCVVSGWTFLRLQSHRPGSPADPAAQHPSAGHRAACSGHSQPTAGPRQ